MPRPSSPRARVVVAVVVTVVVLLAGLVAFVVAARTERVDSGRVGRSTPAPATAPASPALSLAGVARASLTRVVTVEAIRTDDVTLGTGWLFDTQGDFVTNAHVIAGELGVRLRGRDGTTWDGTVLGVDTERDIALIRAGGTVPGPPLPVATQSGLTPPEDVVVVASGRATGEPDVTAETVTQTGRSVPVRGNPDIAPGSGGATFTYDDMLELDGARIFQGNSGGPVLDGQGRVVGIVTLASRTESRAYAIPIWDVVDELRAYASH